MSCYIHLFKLLHGQEDLLKLKPSIIRMRKKGEADGLQLQKTTTGATPVTQIQETEATVCTGSLNLDNRKWENCCLV